MDPPPVKKPRFQLEQKKSEVPALLLDPQAWPEQLRLQHTSVPSTLGTAAYGLLTTTAWLVTTTRHPNLQRVRGDGKQLVTVADSGSLESLELGSRIAILYQLIRALASLHVRGIIHGQLNFDSVHIYRHDENVPLAQLALSLTGTVVRDQPAEVYRSWSAADQSSVIPLLLPSVSTHLCSPPSSDLVRTKAGDIFSLGLIAYVLLGDPLLATTDLVRQLRDVAVKQDQALLIKFMRQHARGMAPLSDSALDLVARCLRLVPEDRISATALLRHKFFMDECAPVVEAVQLAFPYDMTLEWSAKSARATDQVTANLAVAVPAMDVLWTRPPGLLTPYASPMSIASLALWNFLTWAKTQRRPEDVTPAHQLAWVVVSSALVQGGTPSLGAGPSLLSGFAEISGEALRSSLRDIFPFAAARLERTADPVYLCHLQLLTKPQLWETAEMLFYVAVAGSHRLLQSRCSAWDFALVLSEMAQDVVAHPFSPAVSRAVWEEWKSCFRRMPDPGDLWTRGSDSERRLRGYFRSFVVSSLPHAMGLPYFTVPPSPVLIPMWTTGAAASVVEGAVTAPAVRRLVHAHYPRIGSPAFWDQLATVVEKTPFRERLAIAFHELLVLEHIAGSRLFSDHPETFYAQVWAAEARCRAAFGGGASGLIIIRQESKLAQTMIHTFNVEDKDPTLDQALVLLDEKGSYLGHAYAEVRVRGVCHVRGVRPSIQQLRQAMDQRGGGGLQTIQRSLWLMIGQWARGEEENITQLQTSPSPDPILKGEEQQLFFSLTPRVSIVRVDDHHDLGRTWRRLLRHADLLAATSVDGLLQFTVLVSSEETAIVLGEQHLPWQHACSDRWSLGVGRYLSHLVHDNPDCFFDLFSEHAYLRHLEAKSRQRDPVRSMRSEGLRRLEEEFENCLFLDRREAGACDISNLQGHLVDIRPMYTHALTRLVEILQEIRAAAAAAQPPVLARLKTQLAAAKAEIPLIRKTQDQVWDHLHQALDRIAEKWRAVEYKALQAELAELKKQPSQSELATELVQHAEKMAVGQMGVHQVLAVHERYLQYGIKLMDIYTLAQMFRAGAAPNWIFFGGQKHTQNDVHFLLHKTNGRFKQVFSSVSADGRQQDCVRVPVYSTLQQQWLKPALKG